MAAMLDGVRVLDLGQGIAGPFCARLLGAMGATVLKAERPGGDPARRVDSFGLPFAEAAGGASELFAALNMGKDSVLLDLAAVDGPARLAALTAAADVVIENYDPATAAKLGVTPARIRAANPRAVLTSIRDVPTGSPYAGYRSNHLTLMALSGFMHQIGQAGREPLVPGLNLGLYVTGLQAALHTIAALFRRGDRGSGAHVEIAVTHAVNWIQPAAPAQLALLGRHPWPRNSNALPGIVATRDGYVGVNVLTPENWTQLWALIGRPDVGARPEYQVRLQRTAFADDWMPFVREWAAGLTSAEVLALGQEARIPFAPIADMPGTLAMAQHAARGFFQRLPWPGGGEVLVPGSPYQASETAWSAPGVVPPLPLAVSAPSPSPAPAAAAPVPVAPDGAGGRPLAGVRVLELGAWWSAAAAGTTVGALGADVIKIEPPGMDGWRMTAVDPGQELMHERGPMFNTFNLNKRGIVLDIADEAGRETFLRLVEQADVVLENFSPRVMPKLRLDYATLRARNPRIVMASISGYGSTGPWRDFTAHGIGFEQASGLASVSGYEDDNLPRGINAYSDAIVGLWTASAIVGALESRRRTGRGQWIDLAAFEALTAFLGGPLIAYQRRGLLPRRVGNHSLTACPHNIYPCRGEDAWVAIAAESDAEWHALRAAMGDPPWAAAATFDTFAGRKAAEAEIDTAIGAWTAGHDGHELMRTLQAAGVTAAAVVAPAEQLADPGFAATGHFASIARAVTGPVPAAHLPARYDGQVFGHVRPAPLFGEHTAEVLATAGE